MQKDVITAAYCVDIMIFAGRIHEKERKEDDFLLKEEDFAQSIIDSTP